MVFMITTLLRDKKYFVISNHGGFTNVANCDIFQINVRTFESATVLLNGLRRADQKSRIVQNYTQLLD